ncbi:MAG: hypothetical protein RE472_01875 [Thermoplasmatales archaeon]|nr:MAG: hypothetical protein RE472_01875 [Thermoplasmatales archaeon]
MEEGGYGHRILKKLNGLNWKLIASIEPGTEVSKASRKFDIKSEIGFHLEGNEAEINLYFPAESSTERDLAIFISKSGGILENGIWRIHRKVTKSRDYIDTVRELINIPSCVLSSVWIDRGRYFTEFLFSYRDMDSVSNSIIGFKGEQWKFNIEYLGPSEGYERILNIVNNRNPLSVIQMTLKTESSEKQLSDNLLNERWLRILKMPLGTKSIDAVYLTDGYEFKNPRIIKIDDGVYYGKTKNEVVNEINDEIIRRNIVTLSRVQMFEDSVLKAFIIAPTVFTEEILRLISDAEKKFTDWKIELERIETLKEWLDRE